MSTLSTHAGIAVGQKSIDVFKNIVIYSENCSSLLQFMICSFKNIEEGNPIKETDPGVRQTQTPKES